MADTEHPELQPENEGEGSRTGDAKYRAGVQEHLRRGDVEREAEEARRDIEANPDEFRKAEEEGKRRSAGEIAGDAEGI